MVTISSNRSLKLRSSKRAILSPFWNRSKIDSTSLNKCIRCRPSGLNIALLILCSPQGSRRLKPKAEGCQGKRTSRENKVSHSCSRWSTDLFPLVTWLVLGLLYKHSDHSIKDDRCNSVIRKQENEPRRIPGKLPLARKVIFYLEKL